jgi:hypothetical protein
MFYVFENHKLIYDDNGEEIHYPILFNLQKLISIDSYYNDSNKSYGIFFDFGLDDDEVDISFPINNIKKSIFSNSSISGCFLFDMDAFLENVENYPIFPITKKFISFTDSTNQSIMKNNENIHISNKILFSIENILFIQPKQSGSQILTTSNTYYDVVETTREIYQQIYSSHQNSIPSKYNI